MTKNKYEELQKLEELRAQGIISDEEFQYEKHKILNDENHGIISDNKSYITIMHLSQFAGFIFVGLGFIIPILMWLTKSGESKEIDRHGRNIANFMLSMLIYIVISAILCIVLIGIPILITLAILEIVFIIIATIKAANGEYWKYPLSITFFY